MIDPSSAPVEPEMTHAHDTNGHTTSLNTDQRTAPRGSDIACSRTITEPTNAYSVHHPAAGHNTGYQYLEPVFTAYAATGPNDPDRVLLRNQLITGYLPVARNIARRYNNRGEPLEDLEQVACVGLLNALDRYKPGLGHGFLAYAVPTITGEIRRHFRDKTWSIRVPRRLKDQYVSVNRAVVELSQQANRAPRPSEIAAKLNTSTDEVLEVLHAAQAYRTGSLDEMLTSEPDSTTLGARLGRSETRFEKFTLSHSLAPHLDTLPERERNILIMRFFEDMTQTQIAERMGISQMHVSRLLTTTLAQLREAANQDDDLPQSPRQSSRHSRS